MVINSFYNFSEFLRLIIYYNTKCKTQHFKSIYSVMLLNPLSDTQCYSVLQRQAVLFFLFVALTEVRGRDDGRQFESHCRDGGNRRLLME